MRTLALAVALFLIPAWATGAGPPPGLLLQDGRSAPDLRLRDLDGRPFDLGELRGRWVLVHFWASWCAPCRREMPSLQRLRALESDLPLTLVLVNTAETHDEVFAFLNIVAPDLSTLMDPDGLATERWQPRGLPASFLVDPAGRLRYVALGGRDWGSPEYRAFLRRLTAAGG